MTAKGEVSRALGEAFRAASMLTGSTEVAENAALDGIAASEFGNIVDDVLLVETVTSAIRRRPDLTSQSEQAPYISRGSFNGYFCSPRFLVTLLYCEFSLE